MDIHLQFSDLDLGRDVATSKPPEGITVSPPSEVIEASDPAQLFLAFTIVVSGRILSGVAIKLIVDWLLPQLKKHSKGRTLINRKEVVFEERHVRRFVEEEITKYYRATSEDHHKDDA